MKSPFIRVVFVIPLLLACAVFSPSETPTVTPAPASTATPPPAAVTVTVAPESTATVAEPTQPPPEPAQPAIALRVAVRAADGSVQFVETGYADSAALLYQGLPPRGGAVGAALYVLNFDSLSVIERFDAAGRQPLDFGQPPNSTVAVWPGIEAEAARLAFGTSPDTDGHTQLIVAALDGSGALPVVTDAWSQGEPPFELQAQRWSEDGQSLFFSREPYGIGGYILFNGASSLFRYDLADESITPLIPFDMAANVLCLGDLNAAAQRAVGNCTDRLAITVYSLDRSSPETAITPPAEIGEFGTLGSARLSPDASRVAFALARNDPSNEQGWVAVSDGLSGAARLVATADPGSYFTVVGWLNDATLLLQQQTLACADVCPPGLWTVSADGSGLAKLTDGLFLGFVAGP